MNRPFILGLTGSIGMGKSTTAKFFTAHDCDVWDADAAVHRLYAPLGAAVTPIARLCPSAVIEGAVSRPALRDWIAKDSSALDQIEAVVHPLVAEDRRGFLDRASADIVVLDIPLLFEGGGDSAVDAVAVVTAPPDIQKERVMARPGMTVSQMERIMAKQMPDAEKRARADYIIETVSKVGARSAVAEIVADIRAKHA